MKESAFTIPKEKIIRALEERDALQPCPRCQKTAFTLVDGYVFQEVREELTIFRAKIPTIPSVIVVCNHCGYMSQHALGILGLLGEKVEPDEQPS